MLGHRGVPAQWTDAASQHSSTGNDVYAQFVSPAGSLVGNPFPITSSFGDKDAFVVAFDRVHFVITHHYGIHRFRFWA